jgi:hypothetical protein
MKLTPKARLVLEAFAKARDGSIGARAVAEVLGFSRRGPGRSYAAGGYMARLFWEGWLGRRSVYYTGARGHECFCGVRYWITEKGRKILLDSPKPGK